MNENVTLTNRNVTHIPREAKGILIDHIAFEIESYYLWVILGLGFPGNCFSILTIVKMSPARSLTVYVALLAIVDNLAIINKILMFYLQDDGVQIGMFGCKTLGFFGNFLITYGNWILVGFSIERFAAVWFPFTIGKIWTFKKSITVVVSITLPLVGLFLHLFWTMNYEYVKGKDEKDKVFCNINTDHQYFMQHIWFWINVVVYAVLPCLLLLIFNILIIVGIRRSTKIHRFLNRSSDSNPDRYDGNSASERQRQITVMLVTSALALVILTTPRCVLLIMSPYHNPPYNSVEGATLYLIDTIAYVFCDSTHAVNFYLYSLSAKRFRSQFLDLVSCRKRQITAGSTQYINLSYRLSRKSMSEKSISMKK